MKKKKTKKNSNEIKEDDDNDYDSIKKKTSSYIIATLDTKILDKTSQLGFVCAGVCVREKVYYREKHCLLVNERKNLSQSQP